MSTRIHCDLCKREIAFSGNHASHWRFNKSGIYDDFTFQPVVLGMNSTKQADLCDGCWIKIVTAKAANLIQLAAVRPASGEEGSK